MDIRIGMDPEFMVKYKGEYVYPRLGSGNAVLNELPHDHPDRSLLAKIDADEFGHCAEIRPAAARNGKELVLNMISAMEKLPKCFTYHSDNIHTMDKRLFIQLIRALGHKDLSESKNIYGKDILDDCKADIDARVKGLRLVFCGCHMHLSASKTVVVTGTVDGHRCTLEEDKAVDLPVRQLVGLFDKYLFPVLRTDRGFDVGRYRSMGFYEHKFHGGFEYRSLGASAMTPTRIRLIADIMIALTKLFMDKQDDLFFQSFTMNRTPQLDLPADLIAMLDKLALTKRISGDLRKAWVPFD